MTVRELKKALEGFDDDDQVVMSKDGAGNDYSPLADLGSDMYVAGSTWSGEPPVPAACRNRSVAFDYGKATAGRQDTEEQDGAIPDLVRRRHDDHPGGGYARGGRGLAPGG